MELNNYTSFCIHLEEAVENFPYLSIKEFEGKKYLKGILDIPDENQNIVGNFLVEIHFTNFYPYRFPKLFEIGGTIPNHADWHKYSDKSCCITVEPDEILKCKSGIDITSFIKHYAISYFANYIHKKLKGKYKNGEYAHGYLGLKQFYSNLLKTNDYNLWDKYLKYSFNKLKIPLDRNEVCFCNSGIKFKKCHLLVFNQLYQLGEQYILNDFNKIRL